MMSPIVQHTKTLIERVRSARAHDTRTYKGPAVLPPLVVVGLSGGPDSVFLLHMLMLLRQAGHVRLIAAHLNHGWRARAGDDARFCQELCERLEVPLVIGHAAEYVQS